MITFFCIALYLSGYITAYLFIRKGWKAVTWTVRDRRLTLLIALLSWSIFLLGLIATWLEKGRDKPAKW